MKIERMSLGPVLTAVGGVVAYLKASARPVRFSPDGPGSDPRSLPGARLSVPVLWTFAMGVPPASAARGRRARAIFRDEPRASRVFPEVAQRRRVDDLVQGKARPKRGPQRAERLLPAAGLLVHNRGAEQDLAAGGRQAQGQVDLALRALVVAERGPVLGPPRAQLRVVGIEPHLLVAHGQRA